MRKCVFILVLLITAGPAAAQTFEQFQIQHADKWEVIFTPPPETHYVSGNVIFQTESGLIYCDSAVWQKGETVILRGRVIVDDAEYYLVADSVRYNLSNDQATAMGDYVELWAKTDSLFAVGTQAYFDRDGDFFEMDNRPTLYLNYPDSATMIEVIGDHVEYDKPSGIAQASGNVNITSQEMTSTSGCAIMDRNKNVLDLWEDPVAKREQSIISGSLISIYMSGEAIERIDVIDSARGEFNEPVDTVENYVDQSILTGDRLIFDFAFGQLYQITAWGEAYSWYYPSARGKAETTENTVSGDTILFSVLEEKLQEVDVIGGAIGSYQKGEDLLVDSTIVTVVDTIDYNGRWINYNLADSLITLRSAAHVESDNVVLDAHEIQFKTDEKMIRAYSAELLSDSLGEDYVRPYTDQFQPHAIPVQLKDGEEILYGDYLEYSIETEKGRILKSKSSYETGFYYGSRVFRSTKDIFYVEDGRYTTCDADEPHFHFYSNNMKLIEDDKLMARPVVFYLGRMPLLALPYYVFPLKKGRHSGILPFTFGNFEQGDRYVSNLGYYWAASEYWDWQGSFDYFERDQTIRLNSQVRWAKRYAFNGNFLVNYARETNYSPASTFSNPPSLGGESERIRWAMQGAHSQEVTPSFRFSADGQYQSDNTYYNDFSVDLEDRLNRNTRSQLTFSKRFGSRTSLSGSATHDVDLDAESRTDYLPRLNLTLPPWNPFGQGSMNDEGQLDRSWYNNIVATYRPDLVNFSSRITEDSLFPPVYQVDTIPDTVFAGDTVVSITDVIDSTVIDQDTLSLRSRKEYTRVNHSMSLTAPVDIARYFIFRPTLSYNETWFKIWETDQSREAGINTEQTYRTYSYSFGASLQTALYGTIYPNAFGLLGLRQVVTPSLSYRYSPESNRHPEIRSYAGGGAGTARTSSAMSAGLSHVYQAKVRQGEDGERNLELISFNHSFSYDFEQPDRPFSNLNTSFRSSVLPNINFYGSMVHSLYEPGTDNESFFSPYLESFNFSTSWSLSGGKSIFDTRSEPLGQGVDSASQLSNPTLPQSSQGQGWRMAISYDFSQSGRGTAFRKQAFAKLNLSFFLTPTTSVSYSHYYDFARHKTVNSQINIVKNLHCWTGTFYWVPTGSNRGYGFRLYVTAIPSLKIENSQNPLSSSYFQGLQ